MGYIQYSRILGLRYVRESGYLDRGTGRFAMGQVVLKEGGHSEDDLLIKEEKPEKKGNDYVPRHDGVYVVCPWSPGLLPGLSPPGKIMTREYQDLRETPTNLQMPSLLVFCEPDPGLAVALVVIMMRRQPSKLRFKILLLQGPLFYQR